MSFLSGTPRRGPAWALRARARASNLPSRDPPVASVRYPNGIPCSAFSSRLGKGDARQPQLALVDDYAHGPSDTIDLSTLPQTVHIVTAARILGVGRTVASRLVREGAWPTPVLNVGRKIRVPTARLLQLLGVPSPKRQD